ncbi:1,4-alpha-glucan branching protein GlgB [Petrotoga olearia]|uniref:1,4-alpha-glucan branching enzyme GlgB n=2 Tax=Petrotoga olearia TaxID=156203 RepID=A0A2K1P6X1_9BACT|nr:1,4-alpha-glucan branching protein GlgB [Petrotoga olearia]PNR98522.1 glycogen branching protein [Petrotoga olearia DSM 13574]RMA75214.1 1,4-alpha-glucan branching enzyme [Petrotoga olearia]
MPILTEKEINMLVNADCHDPFIYLGLRELDEENLVIRVLQPFAKEAYLISKNTTVKLDKIHEAGLFEKKIPGSQIFEYEIKCTDYNGNTWIYKDPYSFLPVISEYDRYLFNEGNHYKIYEKLGAHPMKINGIKGVLFSTWAPNAKRVSVVGNFNNWDGRIHQMRVLGQSGIWEIFIPDVVEEDLYKFEIKTQNGDLLLKTDPYGTYFEVRPKTAAIVYDIHNKHTWNDSKWMEERKTKNWIKEPMSIYEVHLGSWEKKEENQFLNYRELADKLSEYLKENHFTHIELLPVSEHPLDISWGYQVTGYYAPTSRFGKPEDFMYFVDKMHQEGIGVIVDWVPGHFPKDGHALGRFDGTALYEHLDSRLGEHKDWGTYIFNYGRNEVKNFLLANALFWLDKYHIDGLRVDAVASMLYLDYSRQDGEWIPNKYGGRENLEAIDFIKHLNTVTYQYFPGIVTIAEESTAFPGVTTPVHAGGLGFVFKWNMGWMNDTLRYFSKDPIFRRYHQNDLTFSLVYAFSEKFILSISHDEVVHGKRSLLEKMPGDDWQKFANLRLFYSYMFAHPGKNLLFMGSEIAQRKEWNCSYSLDWDLLQYEPHKKAQQFLKDLNILYKNHPALYEIDHSYEGFEWIDFNDSDNSVISFTRKSENEDEIIVCVFNFTPVPRDNYRIGVPKKGVYQEILNTDWTQYYGSGVDNPKEVYSQDIPMHGREQSIILTLPPLGGLYFKFIIK